MAAGQKPAWHSARAESLVGWHCKHAAGGSVAYRHHQRQENICNSNGPATTPAQRQELAAVRQQEGNQHPALANA
jgi:hypothetical protein